MKKDMKKKWIKALRSGQYDQTTGSLVDPEGKSFCCLGVLCNIQPGVVWGSRSASIEEFDDPIAFDGNKKIGEFGCLTKTFKKKIGLKEETENKLISMNDEGASFDAIANYIQENIRGY